MAVPAMASGSRFARLMNESDMLLRELVSNGVFAGQDTLPDLEGHWKHHARPNKEAPINIESDESEDDVPLSVRKRRLSSGGKDGARTPTAPSDVQPNSPEDKPGEGEAAGSPETRNGATAGQKTSAGKAAASPEDSPTASSSGGTGDSESTGSDSSEEAANGASPGAQQPQRAVPQRSPGVTSPPATTQEHPRPHQNTKRPQSGGANASSRTTTLRGLERNAPKLAEAVRRSESTLDLSSVPPYRLEELGLKQQVCTRLRKEADQRSQTRAAPSRPVSSGRAGAAGASNFIKPNWSAAAKLWRSEDLTSKAPKQAQG